jgi:aminoglycoside adenylyltransferase-like protein
MSLDEVTSSYLRAVRGALQEILGPALWGVYLTGSGALGAFRRDRSDVDIIVIAAGELGLEQKRAVVRSVAQDALPCPARKLELVVYSLPAVTGWDPSLAWELNLNTGAEMGVESSFDPSSVAAHWFVIDAAIAREHAVPLTGPAARDAFGEIEPRRVARALIESIEWHRRHDPEAIQTVLNACRAWRYAEERAWSSKEEAARWARARTEHASLIDAAVAAYEGEPHRRIDSDPLDGFLTHVRNRLLGIM